MSRKAISGARFRFLLKHPFLGDLSLRLVVKEFPKEVPTEKQTIGTDGKHLFFNPAFTKTLNDKQLQGAIAHEVGHAVFRHCGPEGLKRMSEKNQKIWELACEFMVNHFVIDMCEQVLPGNPLAVNQLGTQQKNIYLYDKKYSDGKWTTEEIYYDLLKNLPPEPQGNGGKGKKKGNGQGAEQQGGGSGVPTLDDHSQWGKDKENNGHSPKEGDTGDLEQDWQIWMAQALHSAKRQGRLPAGLERLIGDLLDPKVPWQQVLAEFLTTKSKDDYSYRRPNKRHIGRGIYMPSLYSDTINIGYAMDTSGSMGEEDLRDGLSELLGICSVFPSYKLHIFACDAKVHHYQEVTPMDEIDIKGLCKGGGGTSFVPVFDYIRDNDIKLDALVYFTDAYGDFPDEEPGFPVLWVVKGHGETPWGRRVEYD